jgi:hypothetical protein
MLHKHQVRLFPALWYKPVSNVPLDENESAFGDILLEVTVEITESEIGQYEWIEQGKPYREFLVPAAEINSRMKIRVVGDRREWTPNWARSDDPKNKQP